MKKHGPCSWTECANFIKGRSGKQCRERWVNSLDPKVKRGGWSEEEQESIFNYILTFGTSWSKIATRLEGRTENSIKNYFYSTMRRIQASKVLEFFKNKDEKKPDLKLTDQEFKQKFELDKLNKLGEVISMYLWNGVEGPNKLKEYFLKKILNEKRKGKKEKKTGRTIKPFSRQRKVKKKRGPKKKPPSLQGVNPLLPLVLSGTLPIIPNLAVPNAFNNHNNQLTARQEESEKMKNLALFFSTLLQTGGLRKPETLEPSEALKNQNIIIPKNRKSNKSTTFTFRKPNLSSSSSSNSSKGRKKNLRRSVFEKEEKKIKPSQRKKLKTLDNEVKTPNDIQEIMKIVSALKSQPSQVKNGKPVIKIPFCFNCQNQNCRHHHEK